MLNEVDDIYLSGEYEFLKVQPQIFEAYEIG
jgi:hypothetical protein